MTALGRDPCRRAHVAGGVACATPRGARDQTPHPGSLQSKSRTENAASRRDTSDSDWAVPRPAGILCRLFKKESVNTNRVRNEDRVHSSAANDAKNGCARGGLLRSTRQAPIDVRLGRMKEGRDPTLHGKWEPTWKTTDFC